MKNYKKPTVKIPIIILNWNGINDTNECMNSLVDMEDYPCEIILVDNGSKKEERDVLVELYTDHPKINLVLNDSNKGFTLGNYDIVKDILNREEVPPFIVLLNNDTVVSPSWINSIVSSAITNDADIVSSKMINYYDRRRIDNIGHFMLNTGEILPLGHGRKKEIYSESIENLGACGGAALYRTSMIQEIGFFDLYFDTGYEDAEFGLRAKLLGYKCIFEPSAVVYHKVSRSINKIKNDAYLQHIQTNIFYTYIKLMPKRFLLNNIVFVLSKYMIWFIFGLATFQFKLLKLHSSTLSKYIRTDLKRALIERKNFYDQYKDHIDVGESVLGHTKFFFITDIKRLIFHLFPDQ